MRPLLIGESIGRYRALSQLGAGGMGVVYRAEDLTLRREVALKVLTPTVAPDAVARFLQEARAAASINHPSICTIYDAGEFEGRPYIAMELLDGQTLKDRLAVGLPSMLHALDLAVQIADGLTAAHAKGIIHRDIKPANLAVTDDGRAKILDFGLAKLMPEIEGSNDPDATQLTGHATVLGTTAYMSPEQMRGETLDPRTDLFSFGVVLYEMCTGRRPFTGSNSAVIANAVLSHDPPPLQHASWALPSELSRIVQRALEKRREDRYQRATELLSDLRALKRRLDSGQIVEEASRLSSAIEGRHDTTRLRKVSGPSGVPEALLDYLRRFPDADVQLRRLKHYVWPSASIEDQLSGHVTRDGPAQEILMTTLREDPEALVLLLGDYGSGKTSFLQMFGRELATLALMETGDTPFPLYLNLGFARSTTDLLGALSAYLARYAVAVPATELRDFILHRRNVVLLLDGFDEMAGWVDFGAVPEILERIRHLQSTSGVRLVLSGRTSFFRSDIEVGIVGASHVVRLQSFDDATIASYVKLRDPKLVPRATALFDQYPDLRELCRHPMHLMLFVNWLAADSSSSQVSTESGQRRADAAARVFDDISLVDLYHRFFSKTLQDNFGTLTKWPLNERWAFVRRVAWDWFNDNIFEWPIHEFSKRIAAEFPSLSNDEVDRYTLQLLNCTFFTRVGDRYRFLHRSYIDYLVSEILCDSLSSGELKPWESVLYTDIFEMSYQMLKKRGLDQLDLGQIIDGASLRAQSNILTMSWRHRPPSIEPVVRKQMRHGKFDILRLQSAMGMALYEGTAENVQCLVEAFGVEPNSVVKAMMQRAASHWLANSEDAALQDLLQPIVESEITLLPLDAARATLQRKEDPKDSERILLAYRRAMLQGDRLWPAAVGPMIALGVVGHASSFSYIQRVAVAARHPEIRAAYKLVQPFTGLPDLPPL